MIFSGLTRSILTLVFLAIIAIMYVKLSGLNLKNYFRRVWMIIPVLVLVLSIPAASSMFISGDPLVYLYKGLDFKVWFIRFPSEIYFSTNGLSAIIKMSLRIGVSISFGYLLVMTTRWSSLTKSLTVLRIPSLIISILNMTYRYIYVLSKITCELFEARFLRTVGRLRNKENRTFIASRISFLFVKSSFLSDEIYDSMRCRGYTGETVSLSSFKLSKVDLMWIINNVIIVLILFAI
jgi:cobalt ECF transporter T component CbiQ